MRTENEQADRQTNTQTEYQKLLTTGTFQQL